MTKMLLKKGLLLLASFALLPLVSGCLEVDEPGATDDVGTADAGSDTLIDSGVTDCPNLWEPVCGTDGLTYANDCLLESANVALDHEGECEDVSCSDDECGPMPSVAQCPNGNGPTVECTTDENGSCGWIVGTCEPEICPHWFEPVCGIDGQTYGNECEAGVAHVEIAYEGECEAEVCPNLWEPVCGIDDETYPNDCVAAMEDVEIAHEGECTQVQCDFDDCGPMPPLAPCPDGEGPSISCEPNPAGECEWNIGSCDQPVEHDMCTSDFSCDEDEYCTTNDGDCFSDPDCEPGEPCVDVCFGFCEEVEENPDMCTSDSSCDENEYCTTNNGDCFSDPDCRPGEPCVDVCFGFCEEVEENPDMCTSDSSCDENEYCTTNNGDCFSDPDCRPGEPCTAVCFGFCEEENPECVDLECPQGQLCFDGECSNAACPMVYAPVCGTDGQTYGNECEAEVAHVEIAYEGECENVDCSFNCLIPDPVCGVDGQTYVCGQPEADCNNIEVAHEGECEMTCYSNSECPEELHCSVNDGDCLPDPECPNCAVCTGYCVR